MATKNIRKIRVRNVNHPGRGRYVDARMYEAMRRAFLRILPRASPGLTASDIAERLSAHLPQNLFPKGARAGWWAKTVQLDLEARGLVCREKSRPLRWRRS